jgi:L-malate glycosyltransferase
MKIGITCYPVAGGSGIVATELGQQLASRGHEVHFISYAMPFRLDKFDSKMMYHSVETTAYPLFKHDPYTLPLAAKMAEVGRGENLDILHVHYAIPHATCAYLAKMLLQSGGFHVPKIITTLHGTDITLVGVDPSFFDITRFSIQASDGITAVSHYLAEETQEVFRIDKHIRVVHNFFDPMRFKPSGGDCSRNQFVGDDEFLIGHVSNFRPVKRVTDVIDIFDRIQTELPAKLILIGEGPDTILARRQITKRNLTSKVVFLGNQSRPEALLPCVDLFLMPSEEESFGLAALEALACGVPVVGSAGTGLMEVIDSGVNGFLFPVGDTVSMARAGIDLLKDKHRWLRFKTAAAERVRQKFSAEKIVDEYEKYYMEVLNG